MSDLRPQYITIHLGSIKQPDGTLVPKEYGLLFDLNAIDEIQDAFDISISDLSKLISDKRSAFKAIKKILTILINEAIDDSESKDPHVSEIFVGRKIKITDVRELRYKILMAFSGAMPKVEDEDDPNPQSE